MNINQYIEIPAETIVDNFGRLCDRGIDILLLTETWHDSDSLPIRSLLSKGFSVIDLARPRTNDVTL